jgi:NAD(P)H dehydrogenase (quinone)
MTVLVVGAAGVAGPPVVTALVERQADVRVLSRDADRARALLPGEADVRAGDPGVDDDLLAAADGADALFLLTSHDRQMADLQLRIIRTLRRTGVKIVKLSGTSTAITPDGPYACREHWEIEQVLSGSDQPYVILRPNAFMQTLIDQIMFPAVRATGAIPNAIGTAGISFIDTRDIGRCAAEALLGSSWDGQTLTLTGPAPVTFAEIATVVSRVTGQPVGTLDITPADVRRTLESRGMVRWEAEHFEEMYQLFRDGKSEFVSDDVERMTGRVPGSVESYLTGHPGLPVFQAAAPASS